MADPARQHSDPEHIPGNQESEPASRPDWYHNEHPVGGGDTTPRTKDHLRPVDNAADGTADDPENLAEDEEGAGQTRDEGTKTAEEPADLGHHENLVGRGYHPKGSQTKKPVGVKNLILSRKGAGGGGIIAAIVALVFGFSIISGPLQLIHLSQILSKNFAGTENTSSIRFQGLFRYARTGDVGQTRVGYLGSKVFAKTITDLGKIGIQFDQRNSLTGHPGRMTIDTPKHPDFKDLPEAQRRTAIEAHFRITDGSIVQKVDATTYRVNLNATNVKGINFTNSLAKTSIGALGNGKIATAIQLRSLKTFFHLPKLFSPISKRVIATENRIAAKIEEDRAQSRKGAQTSGAVNAKSRLRDKLGGHSSIFSAALISTAGLCLVRDVADDVVTVNRAEIVVTSAIEAVDKISIGSQMQIGGKELSLTQAGAVADSFKDKDGRSIWTSKALQAAAGIDNPAGEDLPADYKQAFSNDTTASKIKETIGSPKVAGVDVGGLACSKVGLIIQGGVGVAVLVAGAATGPAGWAAVAAKTGASAVATAGVIYLLQKQFVALLRSDAIVPIPPTGPLGGSLLAYGAREAGNISARSAGGFELSPTESAALDNQIARAEEADFKSKLFFTRLFDVNDYRSLASRAMDSSTGNPLEDIKTIATSLLSVSRFIENLPLGIFQKARAATGTPYSWDFPRYGIPASISEDPKYEDPYDNADKVAVLMDSKSGKNYRAKANECFGVAISKGPNGWDATATQDVNPNEESYIKARCNDIDDENWERTVLFIFDTRLITATACYEGQEEACSQLGLGSGDSSASSPPADPGSSDPNFAIQKIPTPLPTSGEKITPKGITLHWWGGQYGQGIQPLVNTLLSRGLSVHLGITSEGKVYQLTNDLLDKTSHAIGGNTTTIGIEIEGSTPDFGEEGIKKYPQKFQAVVTTVKYLIDKYKIPIEGKVECNNVVGIHPHSAYNHCPGAVSKDDIDSYYFNEVIKAVR